MPEPDQTPLPRRGRGFIIVALALAIFGIGYMIVEISTQAPGRQPIEVDGVGDAQRIFGGLRQDGERLGPDDAPVSIQVFADMQCGTCREDFLGLVPALVERQVREGDVKLLLRHYSIARNETELGFFGAEAAAQQSYAWQYTYLFFRNQDEAERHGVTTRFLETIAASIPDLDVEAWQDYLDLEGGPGGEIEDSLDRQSQLAEDLDIRANVSVLVSGAGGSRLLQDGPDLGEVEAAIEEVR